MNEVCVAAVSNLPATGADHLWLLAPALLLVLGGAAALVFARRRAAWAVMPAALLILAGTGVLGVAAAPFAQAASVDYGAGCTLIEVRDATTASEAETLLPGDAVVVMSVIVANMYAGDIVVEGTASVGAPLTGVVTLTVDLGGAPGPVVLSPGQSLPVTVTAQLPTTATDTVQGLIAGWALVLTASG